MCRIWLCVRCCTPLFDSVSFALLTGSSVAVFMAVDMLGRLHAVVGERKTVRDKKSQ